MSVTFQISDKRGDAILLVKAEGPGEQVDAIHAGFVQAAAAVGLQASVDAFDALPGAIGVVQAVFPNAATTITSAPPEPWGNPPVPAFQPGPAPQAYQQPQQPAAAQPYQQPQAAPAPRAGGDVKNGHCAHGPATYREGVGKTGKPYRAYFCPAPKGDPNQCNPEFQR